MLARVSVMLVFFAGCGGHTGRSTNEPAGEEPGAARHARASLAAGDLDAAAAAADRALELDPGDARAAEVAARVALARGDATRAAAVLADHQSRELSRLRARALFRLGEMAQVETLLAPFDDDEEEDGGDGWAAVALPIARGAVRRSRTPWRVTFREPTELAMSSETPVPVIAVHIDGEARAALVSTAADLTVVDRSIRERPGWIDELALGPNRMRDVPTIPRDLGAVSEQLGVQVSAVVGLDVLLRFGATLDFRERRVEVGPADGGGSTVPFVTFDGSFMAVQATLDGDHVAWLTVDTAAQLPVALSDAAVDALGEDPQDLATVPGVDSGDVRMLTLASLRLGDLEVEEVPAITGMVPDELAALASAPIEGILGVVLLSAFRVRLDPERRVLRIE